MATTRTSRRAAVLLLLGFWLQGPVEGQTFESSNLPIVVVQVGRDIPDEPKVTGHLGVIDNGPGVRNQVIDPFTGYDGPIGIEIRGSSSRSFPKKSYAVELRDALGEGVNVPLLGMPAEEDWILYGPYSDKTFMRNALIMRLSNRIGRYASRTRFVELVIDGDYRGVYVVMERIKRDDNRVNIARLDPTETTGEDVTGGYIIKVDKTDGAQVAGWYSTFVPYTGSPHRVFYQYHYPRPDDIVPEQEAYIQNAVYVFESRMASAAWDDPVFGYTRYLDPEAAVDFFLLNELSKNIDGYRLSTYMFRDRERAGEPPPRFVLGPIWDYNLAFGNANYYDGASPTGFFIENMSADDGFQAPFWLGKLWNDAGFQSRIRARWTSLRAGPFHRDSVMAYIDESEEMLREAEARDAARWNNLGNYVWPNPTWPSTWNGELNYFRMWIGSRLAWMDARLLSGVGTEDPELPAGEVALDAYPNPARYSTLVEVSLPPGTTASMDLFDVLGRRIRRLGEVRGSWNPASLRIETSEIPPGLYMIRLQTDRGEGVTRSLIVRR